MNDSSPYWGGGLMINTTGGNACTSAFGVKRNSDGATRMLTAAHCGKTGDNWVDGGYDTMGKVEGNWPYYETQLINARGGTSVWHGSVRADQTSGSDATSKTVRGWAFPEVGQLVCTSGSYSGTRCVIKVTHNNVTLDLGGGLILPGMVQAEQQGRTNAAGNGDSGGPVYGFAATAESPPAASSAPSTRTRQSAARECPPDGAEPVPGGCSTWTSRTR